MLSAISGIFILDPVPHQMREYIPERDNILRRNAENLSAVLRRLSSEPTVSETLLEMTRKLSEAQVSNLASVSSELGDVMLTIEEKIGGRTQPVSARLMSDGTLRFLAISSWSPIRTGRATTTRPCSVPRWCGTVDPVILQLANTWLILNDGCGPTADKPTVTLTTPPDPDTVSAFLNIRVADIYALQREWTARGAHFLTDPVEHPSEFRSYIRDPDGHLIEVGQSRTA